MICAWKKVYLLYLKNIKSNSIVHNFTSTIFPKFHFIADWTLNIKVY